MTLRALILAAGKGTRMRSRLPKALQPLGGRPLLSHVLKTAEAIPAEKIAVVVGHRAEMIRARFSQESIDWILQTRQRGTGHAVMQAVDWFEAEDTVLILYGDVPLVQAQTLRELVSLVDAQHPLALLTAELDDPAGYGRIVRDAHHKVAAIVEQKDATPEQLAIREANTGMMAVSARHLKRWLTQLNDDNAQGEYYLTDIVRFCVEEGFEIRTASPSLALEVMGVNDRVQLASLERAWQRHQVEALLAQGVTVADPARLDIRGRVEAGQDVFIDVNVVLEGEVRLADGVRIGPHCVLRDVALGADTRVHAFSHLEGCATGEGASVGPYARIRPDTTLADGARVGNFVEIKKSAIGAGSKINHLAYIGDTTMGAGVNIGAGVITCNYDGANKHATAIGDGAFIGSDTQLVAPVRVGEGATIGAGSTIVKDAPAHQLTLSRARQTTLKGWVPPKARCKGGDGDG